MPTYKLTDPIYGRTLNIDLDKPPTQEEAMQYLASTFPEDKEYVFDTLKNNKQYVADLRGNWKAEGNKDYKGKDQELIEKDFEYWNSVEFNLGKGALELATTFANLEPKEAQRMLRRFDVYDKTNATGEGSRDFTEQLKGVSWAMITDPTTYAGGYGLLKNLVARSGAKGVLKTILMKAATPMALGAGYAAAADAEHQLIMMELGAQEEYSGTQTAAASSIGAGLSFATPYAAKAASKVVKAVPTMLSPSKWKAGVQKAEEATMETLGGAKAAKEGTIAQGRATLASGGEGHAEAAITASNSLNDELSAGYKVFIDKYKALGELDVRPQRVLDLIKKLELDGIQGLKNIKFYEELMINGQNSPTKTLRLIRAQLGKLHQASKIQGNVNHGADEVLKQHYKTAKTEFSNAASRIGKGKEAKKLDDEFSEYMGIYNNRGVMNASGSAGKASDLISHIVSDPKKSYIRVNEYLNEIAKIGKTSGNKDFIVDQKTLLRTSLAEELFKGKSGKFETFVSLPSGKKTLLALFDDLKPKTLDRWSTILKNSSQHGGASTFWGRLISQTLAGTAGAAAGGLVGAGMSFILMGQFLRSSKFTDMAMRVYSKKGINQKALNRLEKYLISNGANEKQAKWFTANVSGVITNKAITAGMSEETKDKAEQYIDQAGQYAKEAYDTAVQYADQLPSEF